jgi:hypothetical protein
MQIKYKGKAAAKQLFSILARIDSNNTQLHLGSFPLRSAGRIIIVDSTNTSWIRLPLRFLAQS